MRIVLAVLLLGLGTADAVWLNLELLPQALRDSDASTPQQAPVVAAAGAGLAPTVAKPSSTREAPTVRAPAIVAEELEGEIIVVEEESPPVIVPSYAAAQASLQSLGPIRFATGRTELSEGDDPQLRSAVELLDRAPELRLEVRGHADRKGNAALNRRLARARAVSVQRALVDRGVARERITITSAGTREPVRQGDDAESLAANRRVELHLLQPSRSK